MKTPWMLALATLFICGTRADGIAKQDAPALGGQVARSQGNQVTGTLRLSSVRDGLFGMYSFPDGNIGYFETRRGPRTPEFLRMNDPATPEFEIDVVFRDSEWRPFLVQIGGHAPMDGEWVQIDLDVDDVQRQSDFMLAERAVASLAGTAPPLGLDAEYQALERLAPVAANAQVVHKVEDDTTATHNAPYATKLNPKKYKHVAEVHQKWVVVGVAKHGAVLGKTISNTGTTTTVINACNHGTCAEAMNIKCSWASSANRTDNIIYNECSTPYEANSMRGTHNSNDDCDLQYQGIRNNKKLSSTSGTCSDSRFNTEPKGCY